MAELAEAGVARVSVGGAFAFTALAAVADAAEELLGPGTTGFLDRARRGSAAARTAFRKG
jgi:2-methylisocitrate lyase-like PEP mutase family enzyme